jgi:hypothetical protein
MRRSRTRATPEKGVTEVPQTREPSMAASG